MNIELKDYFAGQALQGMLAHNAKTPIGHIVTLSYYIAEKMIEHKHKLINDKYINSANQIKLDNVENL